MNINKTAVVLGGAGFVGKNVCKRLLSQGYDVLCVDNFITSRRDNQALLALQKHENFRLFDLDITSSSFLSRCSPFNISEIYHLACPTGVPNIQTMGPQMLATCSTGTENALKLALATGAKLVYTSSAEVYGDPKVSPQTEDYTGNVSTTGPRSAYEEGKRVGETWVKQYHQNYFVNAKIVRIFNTYGEGMSIEDTRVIPSFIRKIKCGDPIVIYGDGEQKRSHMHVDDLVNGLQAVLRDGQAGEAYNVGGETPISIKQLANTFREIVDQDFEVQYKPHFIEDHGSRKPCVKKANALDWRSSVSLHEGLARMIGAYGLAVKPEYAHLLAPQDIRVPAPQPEPSKQRDVRHNNNHHTETPHTHGVLSPA